MYLDAALFEILLPLYGLGLLRLERLEGGADFHFTLIAFDFLLVDLLLMLLDLAIMLLDLAKPVLDRANKMLAFRHYDCWSLGHVAPSLARSAPAACFAFGNRPRLRSLASNASKPDLPLANTTPRYWPSSKTLAITVAEALMPPPRRVRASPSATPRGRALAGRVGSS